VGLDRVDHLDLGGVDGDVQTGAEADLDDGAVEPGGGLGPQAAQRLAAEDEVGDPGQDLLGVEVHPPSLPPPGGSRPAGVRA
jgi:hypothetical protein